MPTVYGSASEGCSGSLREYTLTSTLNWGSDWTLLSTATALRKSAASSLWGKQEFDRSRHAPRSPDPLDDPNPDPKLIEIAKKAWEDVKYHRVPDPEPPPPLPVESADVLDVAEAPKIA